MANLLTTGDMEAGAGNPYIPTGWINVGLAAGESVAEAAIVHAGAQSLEFVAAASGDGIRQQITAAVGDFVLVSMWSYGDGSAGFTIGGLDATQLCLQTSDTLFNVATSHAAFWTNTVAVFRVVAANPSIYILADAGAAGLRYIDDVSAAIVSAVTLTVTPASYANSLEVVTTPPFQGLRVDGFDNAQQPVPAGYLWPDAGDIRWNWTPRHGDTEAVLFGNATPYEMRIQGDAGNYIEVLWTAANTLTVRYNANGAGVQAANWATGGAFFVPAVIHQGRVRYWAGRMILYVDNVARATINAATGFVWPATTAYWGSDATGANQSDTVFSASS